MASARRFPFPSPHRVIVGVHDNAPALRANPQPARGSRLAQGDVLVVRVADLAERRLAG